MGVDNKWYNEKNTVKRDQNIQLKKLVLGNRLILMIYYNELAKMLLYNIYDSTNL